MRCLGSGHSDLQTFCGMMNLPPLVQKGSNQHIKEIISKAVSLAEHERMRKAAGREYQFAHNDDSDSDANRNIDVSVDGTYMTRGHSSIVGVVTLIGCVTGKVLDTGTLSKTCKSCDYWNSKDKTSAEYRAWKSNHTSDCTVTHNGSSGGMEANIASSLFSRSVENYSLRYTRFIGDGDTNSFKTVSESKPYKEIAVEKIECVGHVQKRMGTRLRKLKNVMSGKTLSDGKKIGGKGRLTDAQIDSMQSYYGNAIRGNKQDLMAMREAVLAIYFHKLSSDDKPYHSMCKEQWCKYKKAETANQLDSFKHQNSLPAAIMEVIKPIFRDLSHPDLLKKCLDGYTQNANESINNIIWQICPKNKYHGLKTVEIGVGIATLIFNDGSKALKRPLELMKLTCGKFTQNYFQMTDANRIKQSEKRKTEASLEARRAKRRKRLHLEENQEEEEGFPYLAGAH
ncbi:hypothetical protein RRG08_056736 [Elysia crispata]|uniref:Mutator-like transposase domain-containing protein n=1 Tax=Elysia crispata TaxID=231223 RepID=A0AAE0YY81_9GAST|nr:hypothetical protein RRG08_056736 [Elysia crispata]